MRLVKFQYDTYPEPEKTTSENVARKIEYFLHYWQFNLKYDNLFFDNYYLKSHRTILDKIRLQIDGNYEYARKYIEKFLCNDIHYNTDNIIIAKIRSRLVQDAISNLKDVVNLSKRDWMAYDKNKLQKWIKDIQKWINRNYNKSINKTLLNILSKKAPITDEDKDNIKKLTNYIIIELLYKGFNKDYIEKLYQDALNNTKPSNTDELILSFQNLLEKHPQKLYLVFRVHGLIWNVPPLDVVGVTFYNPTITPKISNNQYLIFKEDFTFNNSVNNNQASMCNAIVEVEGIQKEGIYHIGLKKGFWALSLLNNILKKNGQIYKQNSFVTDLNHIWGSSDALITSYDIDKIEQYQSEAINYLNQLDVKKDKKALNFISKAYEILNDKEGYKPDKLWMILEATFGNEEEIKKILKNALFIHLHYNYIFRWKLALNHTLGYNFQTCNYNFYKLSMNSIKAMCLGDESNNSQNNKTFINKKSILTSELNNIPLMYDINNLLGDFNDRKTRNDFKDKINNYIEYILDELYTQRNLSAHKNMSDELFLLKRDNLNEIMRAFISRFIYYYSKSNNSIERTVKKIDKDANK